jgi:transposase-like protein
MIAETKTQCPKCSSPMQDVKGGITRCQNCGWQAGITYRGTNRPHGCDPHLVAVLAHGNHCNNCGENWLA